VKGGRLSDFEELVLLAVRALGDQTYGVPVQEHLERATRKPISMGPVYAALDRLEQSGLVRSMLSAPTPEPGGKRKRLFSVTPLGMRTLQRARAVRERLWRAIEESK
jgi:DNA-binding PadR family transcriptional regulator